MKSVPLLVLSALAALIPAGLSAAADPAPRLRVARQGAQVWIRSTLSPTHDVVVITREGANGQVTFEKVFVVPGAPKADITDLAGALQVHYSGDDVTPWFLNGTYIGANHGCSDARRVPARAHGLTEADLGSEWADGAGGKFYLVKVPDKDNLWFLSENAGKGDVWKFTGAITGGVLKRKGGGGALDAAGAEGVQLLPACRVTRQDYLTDGKKPLPARGAIECETFDVVEEYDVINPAAVLADVVAHPGQKRDWAAPGLAAVVANRIVYRFLPNGACVISYQATAKQDFRLGYMGFVQAAALSRPAPLTVYDCYIPKTTAFTQDGVRWDFEAKQDYTKAPAHPLVFSAPNKNVADEADLPDRFVHLLGDKKGDRVEYQVGFACGYSLVRGMTVPARRAAGARNALTLYTSLKTYPVAVDDKMNGGLVKAGTEFDCVAYRQYFWPGAFPNATCCYWHPEVDETVVYVGYHKAVERDVLKLPAAWAGKALRVVEKSASVTLHGGDTVPEGGLVVSVKGGHGALVVAVK